MTRHVEVRRHSLTKKGEERGTGSHLSEEGVRLAREVGASIGPFSRVMVSDVPRTPETAIAMGFAVDDVFPFAGELSWERVIEEIGWHALWDVDEPFAHIARNLDDWPETRRMADYYARGWRQLAMSIGEDEAALVVSHGQLMEVALVACTPNGDHSSWGAPFGHCEGFRLRAGENGFEAVQLLRVSDRAP